MEVNHGPLASKWFLFEADLPKPRPAAFDSLISFLKEKRARRGAFEF
jgi:hypothetical protein